LLNEILNKGFDGHQFINGLNSHVRDLLVCKDKITVQLLEVGSEIKEKYIKQSESCAVDFLLGILNIGNTCDIQYKVSQNKRLLVELSLIQMAQVSLKKKQ